MVTQQAAPNGIDALPAIATSHGLADLVLEALRDAITRGDFQPGERLPEIVLARRLGVSATPVREALRSLEREGLVVISRHRGAAVVTTTPAELADLYEMHEILEGHAVARAAEIAGGHDGESDRALATAAGLLDEIDAALASADQAEFNRLNILFHRELNQLGGNSLLVPTIDQFHRRIQATRIHFDVALPGRPATSQAQHRQILHAVRAGDAGLAGRLAREHVRGVRDQVLELLRHHLGPHAP